MLFTMMIYFLFSDASQRMIPVYELRMPPSRSRLLFNLGIVIYCVYMHESVVIQVQCYPPVIDNKGIKQEA